MFQNNKILILGFARSGYNAAKFLIKRGNDVTLNDSKSEDTYRMKAERKIIIESHR